MQLLLTLLRILGILILAVFLLVLLVVLLVLLVPVRYQVWAESKEEKSLHAKVRVHWLLHLISLTAEYRDELTYRLRVLGITVFDEKKAQKAGEEPVSGAEEAGRESQIAGEGQTEAKIRSGEKEEVEVENPCGERNESPQITLETSNTESESKSFREKLEDIWIRIIEFIGSIPEKIAALLEKWADFQENMGERVDALLNKINQLIQKKDRWMKQIRDEQNQMAVKEIFRAIGKLLKHIRPRKLKIIGRLGFDDPAQTGQVFGIIGMLMPLYGEHIQLEAVFDEKIMEGQLYLSGRVRIGSLLWIALRLVFRKEVRRLVQQIQKLKRNPQH